MIQMSMNLMSEVWGSFEEIELFRVYMTSMAVIETGMAVLKCSRLKYKVAWKETGLSKSSFHVTLIT